MSKTMHAPRGSMRGRFCRRAVRFKVRLLGWGCDPRSIGVQVWRWAAPWLTPGQASAAAAYAMKYAQRLERARRRMAARTGAEFYNRGQVV